MSPFPVVFFFPLKYHFQKCVLTFSINFRMRIYNAIGQTQDSESMKDLTIHSNREGLPSEKLCCASKEWQPLPPHPSLDVFSITDWDTLQTQTQWGRQDGCDLELAYTSFMTLNKSLNFSASISYSVSRHNAPYIRDARHQRQHTLDTRVVTVTTTIGHVARNKFILCSFGFGDRVPKSRLILSQSTFRLSFLHGRFINTHYHTQQNEFTL